MKGGASDSPVFAESKVEHVGQVIGLVVADSPRAAQEGAAKVAVRYGHPKVCNHPFALLMRLYVDMACWCQTGEDSIPCPFLDC